MFILCPNISFAQGPVQETHLIGLLYLLHAAVFGIQVYLLILLILSLISISLIL